MPPKNTKQTAPANTTPAAPVEAAKPQEAKAEKKKEKKEDKKESKTSTEKKTEAAAPNATENKAVEAAKKPRGKVAAGDILNDISSLLTFIKEDADKVKAAGGKGTAVQRGVLKRVTDLEARAKRALGKREKKPQQPGTGFARKLTLSKEMLAFVNKHGQTELKSAKEASRVEVTKTVSDFIKNKNLYDAKTKLINVKGTDLAFLSPEPFVWIASKPGADGKTHSNLQKLLNNHLPPKTATA